MELDKFIEHFNYQFDDRPEGVTGASVFRDLNEWSSVVALMIIAMADEEYGVKLTGDDIRGCTTVGDIFEKIKSKKAKTL